MASKPPFELEDQTDEDFFDKLVEEDDDDGVMGVGTKVGVDLEDFDDSAEAEAFAHLNLNESGNEFDASEESALLPSSSFAFDDPVVSDGGLLESEVKSDTTACDSTEICGPGIDQPIMGASQLQEAEKLVMKESSLPSSDSFSFNNEVESAEGVKESEVSSTVDGSKSSDLSGSGVKEVNWSSFSDAVVHDSNSFGSYSDFFTELGTGQVDNMNSGSVLVSSNEAVKDAWQQDYSYTGYGTSVGETTTGAGSESTQNLENPHPGWKYDHVSGQWYQVDGYGAVTSQQNESYAAIGNAQGNFDSTSQNYWGSADGNSSSNYYAQQSLQSVSGTVSQVSATNDSSSWNQVPQGSTEYPAHMVFDPQYPDYYYDTIRQKWHLLEEFNSNQQPVVQTHQVQNDYTASSALSNVDNVAFENQNKQNLAVSYSENNQQNGYAWQPATFDDKAAGGSGGHLGQISFTYDGRMNEYTSQHNDFSTLGVSPSLQAANQVHDAVNRYSTAHYTNPGWSPIEPSEKEKNAQAYFPAATGQNFLDVSKQLGGARSSTGRPPHALVTFGFGGKLVVMKDNSFASLDHGVKDAQGQTIFVFNLMEVVSGKYTDAGTNEGPRSYFHALCQKSFPGPLVGGNVGSKELNKWIDERISHCKLSGIDHAKEEALELLLSLLKIACQHYGKLRSLGTDSGTKESDAPEAAVAKLFASVRGDVGQFGDYSTFKRCLINGPSEAQLQATASEIQNLLVNGRKMEALQCAQEGHWWAFALILARELGDQFYASTVKQMALSQLVAGTPLRTLCLLIAKSPGDVFVSNTMAAGVVPSPVHGFAQPAQFAGTMLDNWPENLAVITANRTENDHLVITHLGDCLWKEKSDIIAAHACYLVAEAEFQSYSDSSRLCLVGADHWNFPRTYASPEAIQRTELLEYSKVLGNSQFVLLPFQPYKIVYAHMLAEVGKVSDSLKYCQAVYKCLKTARSPEVDAWKQIISSLEERIKTHQRGGYSVNLAPNKFVGKILSVIDSTAQRVVGPPPVTLTPHSTAYGVEQQMVGPALVNSQSTMSIPTLTPSASMEPVSQWAVNSERMTAQNRCTSEPVMAKTPTQVSPPEPIQDQAASSNESASSKAEEKAPQPTSSSRFRRFAFGTQLLQKTVGLLKPRQGKQAKLGEENKFYYDEKLKRWVEDGAKLPPEEEALPPPPTALSNTPDYDLRNALHDGANESNNGPANTSSSSESSPGIPSNPPSINQFSARSRIGVRSRYVDTFNKGGGSPANLFPKPSISPIKPAAAANAKFFVPAPPQSSSTEQSSGTNTGDQEVTSEHEQTPFLSSEDPFQKLSPLPSTTMPRFPSVDNIPNNKITAMENVNGSLTSLSRRTASWSGGRSNTSSPPVAFSPQPLRMSPLSSAGSNSSAATPLQANNGSLEGDLHEVEL